MISEEWDKIKLRTINKLLSGNISLQNMWRDFDKLRELRQNDGDIELLRTIVLGAVEAAFENEVEAYELEQETSLS